MVSGGKPLRDREGSVPQIRELATGHSGCSRTRNYYANAEALKAARLPEGSVLFVEISKAKRDDGKNQVKDSDGFFVADKLAAFTAMEKHSGWGEDIPDDSRRRQAFSARSVLRGILLQNYLAGVETQ